MPYDTSLPSLPYPSRQAGLIPDDIHGVALDWYINETPLLSRLAREPVGSPTFKIVSETYRPQSQALAATIVDGSTTSATFADTSYYVIGDVLEIDDEHVLITAKTSSTVVAIKRGYANTTPAAHTSGKVAYLMGQHATGADVDTVGVAKLPNVSTQYVETIQHVVQVGGKHEASTNYVSGFGPSPFRHDIIQAVHSVITEFERRMYYGRGQEATVAEPRQQQKGLKTLLVTNNVTNPDNAAVYKPSDLIRDAIQPISDNGGNPTLMLCSGEFLRYFAIWGMNPMRLDAGASAFGTPIRLFYVPFHGGISLVPAPFLRRGTIVTLQDNECRVRIMRPLQELPRGRRGDAYEADVLIEGAIEVRNEQHHSWVSGITGVAPE